MYWLLDYEKQEEVRQTIISLQSALPAVNQKNQKEQTFPFIGRKDRNIARIIIENLSEYKGVVCDPFSGSGTFAYAALDAGRNVKINEWEPYAFRLSTSPFRELPKIDKIFKEMTRFSETVEPIMNEIYKTRCPACGREFMFEGLFFDRDPEEYFQPTYHERMGPNTENIIFRGKYKCACGVKEKFFDSFDLAVKTKVDTIVVDFPNAEIIENSRLNFTAPDFIIFENLFSHRQRVALVTIRDAIQLLDEEVKPFFEDTFLSIIHLGKYHDYRSKSQDNHCPPNRLKEPNLYFSYIEKLKSRLSYILNQKHDNNKVELSCKDFRDFLNTIGSKEIDLVLTDPPYGDSAQYFEHAQRVHPFMNFSLINDRERLIKEVVRSNAPIRIDKATKSQFLIDIETLFRECSRVIKTHGYLVLYFRPEQSDWISDLNKLKHFARKNSLEPLVSQPLNNIDPSMRMLSSAAWTFSKDICFIFLKLADKECRWYEGDIDVDELVYRSALSASDNVGQPFVFERFNQEFRNKAISAGMTKLLGPSYQKKIEDTLTRFCVKDYAQYRLLDLSPYSRLNSDMDAEVRLREFVPIVIEELCAEGKGFTFEDYIIHLASFMDNGSKKIIDALHRANRLVPDLLLQYAEVDEEQNKFFAKDISEILIDPGRIAIRTMDPSDFEKLIADFFRKRGYLKANVIGCSCDRGVDVLSTNAEGELELIQCKRYRKGNNIGSTPIQRVDSYMRSRGAKKAWVITTSDFTSEGYDEARITGVKTINGDDLIRSLEIYYPGKYCL